MNHRYKNYTKYSSLTSVNSMGYGDELNGRSPQPPLLANGHSDSHSFKDRLQTINTAMSWIRDELEELKESDRTLMEIFKQLEGDVSDLTESVGSWRLSTTFKDGRPMSNYSDLDGPVAVRPHSGNYDQSSSLGTSQNSLESTLTSSKEEVSLKTSSGSDSLLVPEADTASSSNSPVLSAANNSSPLTSTAGFTRRPSAVMSSSMSGGHAKRQNSASPPLKASVSLNRIANTPGINRLQDDTTSNISRNSSIDSGIQFASETENNGSCSNGVVDNGHHFSSPSNNTTQTQTQTKAQTTTTTTSTKDSRNTKAESVSFADDIFSMFGIQSS